MPGSWDLRSRTPAPLLAHRPHRAGSGAATLSESSSRAGKGTLKLSWEARRSVRPRVCASVRVRLETRAAFRHSEPGLNSARGSPGGRGADARALRCCVVSARRMAGSATLWGLSPSPQAVRPAPGCRGAAGILREQSVRPIQGLRGWASASASSGPKGAVTARSPLQFTLVREA